MYIHCVHGLTESSHVSFCPDGTSTPAKNDDGSRRLQHRATTHGTGSHTHSIDHGTASVSGGATGLTVYVVLASLTHIMHSTLCAAPVRVPSCACVVKRWRHTHTSLAGVPCPHGRHPDMLSGVPATPMDISDTDVHELMAWRLTLRSGANMVWTLK